MGLDFRLGRLDSRDFQAQRKRIYTLCAAVRSRAVYTPILCLVLLSKLSMYYLHQIFNPYKVRNERHAPWICEDDAVVIA
ncbi:hypothetical protein PILCRDRAFT_196045 [Piloderma croceum F 1598]|uniref:Uncharacterized protein n=1 Tax=Piloderma croceum (strain F 1598) TaxID=765440 RepID=A0A0C3BTA5_PILCF|nr:hypothetical protein PILCRDRAFT_196045 [Piloderma croceum F 1598]